MPMSEIENMKDEFSATLDKNPREFLDNVYADLESGAIDRETFQLIMKELNGRGVSEIDCDSRAYIEEIYRDFKDNETFTTVFSGVASTDASFIKDMLENKVQGEVIDASADGAAKWGKQYR